MSLKTFTDAYIECLLWSETDDDGDNYDHMSADDLAPEALAEIENDCANFYEADADEWADDLSDEQAGHDFCLTRNGHGAGFWDRGLGELGTYLTKQSKPYGTQGLYLGDDGMLYVHN